LLLIDTCSVYILNKWIWPYIAKQFEYYITNYIKQTFQKQKSNNIKNNLHHNKTRDSVDRACHYIIPIFF
jgi:hypothetical protein